MLEEHPGLTKLRALLADTPVVLTYKEEEVGYPGGSYVNRLIGANGEWFCADLTDRNPYVTADEIRGGYDLRSTRLGRVPRAAVEVGEVRSHWDDIAPYIGTDWVSRRALIASSGITSGNVQRGLNWGRDQGVLEEGFERNGARVVSKYRLRTVG